MDIVERLENLKGFLYFYEVPDKDMQSIDIGKIASDAKDEIERLRNDLRLVIMTDNEYCKGLGEDTKRLRRALEKMQRSRDRYRQAWEAEKTRAALKEEK